MSLLPIGRLPKTHPAITKPTCGTKLTVDDLIPTKSIARWKKLPGQKKWKPTMQECPNAKLRTDQNPTGARLEDIVVAWDANTEHLGWVTKEEFVNFGIAVIECNERCVGAKATAHKTLQAF